MSLKVEKPVMWGNEEFSGYEIIGVEWFFKRNEFFVLTEYFWKNKNIRRLIKHKFDVTKEVNVDELIEKVHSLHN